MTGIYSKHLDKWVVKTRGNIFPGALVQVKTAKGKIFPVCVDKILWEIDGITTFVPKRALKPRRI